ncbi:hypothetical protein [Flindersiella endophytica]
MNGTFEDKLLGQLKQVVTERAAEPVTRRHWRPRLALAGAVAATAAIGIAAPVLVADRTSPAWAVTQTGDRIHVTILDYRDAEGLERKLESMGVSAVVDYPPAGMSCGRNQWFLDHPNEHETVIWFDGDGDTLSFWFRRDTLRPEDTLVIETRVFDVRLGNDVPEAERGIRSVPSIQVAGSGAEVPPCDPTPDDRLTR